jgi:hypothetical protein
MVGHTASASSHGTVCAVTGSGVQAARFDQAYHLCSAALAITRPVTNLTPVVYI